MPNIGCYLRTDSYTSRQKISMYSNALHDGPIQLNIL